MRARDYELMEKIKAYVEDYAMKNGGATPCMQNIGAAFGFHHVTAYNYLLAMDERGKLHTDRIDKMTTDLKFAPAYSSAIPAGTPDEIEAQVEYSQLY